jgi:hypothetical protein
MQNMSWKINIAVGFNRRIKMIENKLALATLNIVNQKN